MTLKIIIPAWNEAGQIRTLFDRLLKVGELVKREWKVFLIDDGSTDATAAEAERYQGLFPLSIIRHQENRGVSAAFRTGFDAAMRESSAGDVILSIEANKNSDLSILPRMIELVDSGSDLVLASCYAPGGAVIGDPPSRLLLSKSINLLLRVLFPFQRVHTYTSFYRLWSYRLVADISAGTDGNYFTQNGFVCMADMLLEARKIPGIKVKEIPLILKSDIRDSGSKMNIGRTIMGYLKLIVSHKFL